MQLRKLGQSDLTVPPLCFGSNVLGWTVDENTAFSLLDALMEAGLNFIDTADVYSRWVPGHVGGESEIIIGNWMKARGNRAKVIVATKVGMEMAEDKKGLKPAYIRQACEDSLRRLQTDRIDLYQSHADDADTPQEDVLETYDRLIEAGKIRVIGASNFSAARFGEALKLSAEHGLPRYESLQPEYNLYTRSGYEAELEPLCRANDIGVISFYGLAAGFLTGKYRSERDLGKSPRGARSIGRYLNERGFRILEALDTVAEDNDVAPGQVALAWLMARPGLTAPIASATSLEQLNELIAATRLMLSASDIAKLDSASA
jgi:aryl-alcohol dehydrogenase-like predicted oxidoreductase